MLRSVAPERRAKAWPSPVHSHELEVTFQDFPIPPVANIMPGHRGPQSARSPASTEGAGHPAAISEQVGDRKWP